MRFTLLAVLLSTSFVHASITPPPVESLDQGACWISQIEEGVFRVASFNDQVAFHVDAMRMQYEFEMAFTKKLKELGLQTMAETDYQIHLHCSSAGHILMLNFKAASTPLCVFTSNKLNEMTIYANPTREDGACRGVGLESLLIKALDPIRAKELVGILEMPKYEHIIKETKLIASVSTISITLQPNWRFREAQAMEMLKTDPDLTPHIENVMYDHVMTVVGESRPLFSRRYRGY